MKHLALPAAAFCLALSGALAFAQQPQSATDQQPPAPITRPHVGMHRGHRAPDPHRQAMMLSRRLNLSQDQTARLEPILADREQKVAALRANTALTPEQMHQQMRTIHEQERTQLAAVLTPEQQEQMKSMRHGHHPHGQPDKSPATGL